MRQACLHTAYCNIVVCALCVVQKLFVAPSHLNLCLYSPPILFNAYLNSSTFDERLGLRTITSYLFIIIYQCLVNLFAHQLRRRIRSTGSNASRPRFPSLSEDQRSRSGSNASKSKEEQQQAHTGAVEVRLKLALEVRAMYSMAQSTFLAFAAFPL